MICVLSGGVGAARFLRGLTRAVGATDITAIVNTGDDTVLHGLNICPDLDTITYTLANEIDTQRGWGLNNESWTTMGALARFENARPRSSQAAPTWFNLGDKDLATHFYRTARLAEGASLAQVTAEITRSFNLDLQLLPMTNEKVSTVITLANDCAAGKAGTDISFQEYFVKHRHSVAVQDVQFIGASTATALGTAELTNSSTVVIAPSNPLVSIAPIRALAGIDEILRARRKTVVAISPIIAGAALKGPADRLMGELGFEPTVVGIARLYAPICGTLIIDKADLELASAVEAEGMQCVVTDTVMSTLAISESLAKLAIESHA